LDVNTGVPCGLIVNELVSNAIKHAFPNGRQGCIEISMQKGHEEKKPDRRLNTYALVVSDNGVGLPKDLDFRKTESLGLQLVNTLTDQIGGCIALDTEKGTTVKITFSTPAPG